MDHKEIRVLVVTYLPWRNDVSVGNTLTNLFGGLQGKVRFANVYFKGGKPQNSVACEHFYIPEMQLAKSIFTRKAPGCVVESENTEDRNKAGVSQGMYDKARQMRWESMLLAQDLIGLFGQWKSAALDDFITRFDPDIVFGPLGRIPAANILMKYMHDRFSKPVVAYAWDDHYSLKKKSWSVFFWAKTFLERRYIKQCADICSYLYTITAPMKEEYQQYFHKECKVLYKGYDFRSRESDDQVNRPVRIVYMGNIGAGRWQVIAKVAQAVAALNKKDQKAELLVYTMSPKSDRIERALAIAGSSRLMEPVPSAQVLQTMRSADILLHVEPIRNKALSFFRLSFSTKIVDYLYCGKCIFAVGGKTAAMDYLADNDAAVVELDENCIEKTLSRLICDPKYILSYGQKAWDCGFRNHQRKQIQENLYRDFWKLVHGEGLQDENR